MAAAVVSIAFVWISIWLRFREPAPEPPPAPPDLRVWDFLGCHRLQFDTWVADDGGDAPTADGQAGAGQAPDAGASPADAGGSPAGPPVVRSLMLFADSVDEFGRPMNAYRAVPLETEGALARLETRWFTRADTLWFIWSSDEVRGAVALRDSRGGMVGRAVTRLRGAAAAASPRGNDAVQARASAWEVNCHSLRPDRIAPVDR